MKLTVFPPLMVERDYAALLRREVRAQHKMLAAGLPSLEPAMRDAVAFRGDAADWSASVFALFERVMNGMLERFRSLPPEINRVAASVDRTNREQWWRLVRQHYGVDVFKSEPWLRPRMEAWERENIQLIENVSRQSLARTRSIFFEALRNGTTQRDLATTLQERWSVDRSRANLIARDQVSKLNGQLTQARQEQLGVKQYRWRTSGDERVRPSHRANSGKTFSWDKPPARTGHPGQDVQCRCTAEAIFPAIQEILGDED